MFGIINRLLFGGEEKTPDQVKSGEVVDDGWLVVSHQEAVSADEQKEALTDNQPQPGVQTHTESQQETHSSVSCPEVQSPNSTSDVGVAAFGQPRALPEATHLSCIQKAKSWAERHHTSRNGIQRQNRLRQGVQQHAFHLQQPGHRSLGH